MKHEQKSSNHHTSTEKREGYGTEYLKEAHRATFANEGETTESCACRCFYCGYRFNVHEEEHLYYSDEREPLERTLHCPHCLVDAVIGSASGFPIDDQRFIIACTEAWFEGISEISDGAPQKRTVIIVD